MSAADPRNPSLVQRELRIRAGWARYGFAVLAVAVATLLQLSLFLLGPFHQAFILFYPTVVIVAMLTGFWPGIVATVLSAVSAGYFFIEPRNTFAIRTSEDLVGPTLFALIGVLLTTLTCSRNRAERAWRANEADLSRAQAIAHIGSWHYDMRRQTLALSDEARRILGLPAEAAASPLQACDLIHPADLERLQRAWMAGLDSGVYDEEPRVLVQGRKRWVHVLGSVERNAEGRPVAALGTVQDITEQREAQEKRQLFRTLIDHSNDAVEVIDPKTLRFLDVNEKACVDLGHTREEMLALTVFDIDPTVDEALRVRVMEKLKDSGSLVLETLHRRKDGSVFPVEVSLKRVELDRSYIVSVARDISERKKAEDALRDSEDRCRDLVDHSEDLVCTHDLEGKLLSVNPSPARILGYEVAEMLAIPMREMIAPEYRTVFDEYLVRIRLTGSDNGLMVVLTRTGERRTWEYRNTLRTQGVASPVVRGMAHDVTERRQAELALQSSEQRYRMLFEKSLAGVAIADADGRVVDCNNSWARILGYESAEEIRGRSAAEFYFNLEDRHPILERLGHAGASHSQELQLRRKDGAAVWVLFNCTVLSGADGARLTQATVIDINERKLADEALRHSEERFRVALKGSPVTVFNQDRDLRYTWIYNPHFYWQHDVLGKTDAEIIGSERAVRLAELKRKVLETGIAVRGEVQIPHNGRQYAVDITIEPLLDAEGKLLGITGAALDIARLRELADGLQQAKDKLVQEKLYLEGEIEAELGFEEIIGQSPALRDVLRNARVVAPTDSTVLLLGETGTGKELVARSIHSLSARHDKSFIKLNCAAVPSGLLESELFGHEKGAFTGAVSQKAGRLELADKGTLFLDEIGELPLELQPKLLRVLQDREFERLGGVHTLHVDVRIISATNRDLRQDVADKKFREDLFYRLNVFPIQLPALRARRSDIPMLVHHFVRKHAARMARQIEIIPGETMSVLQDWSWPGNIRELENMIERMVILTRGHVLAAPPVELDILQDWAQDNLSEMEREHILRVLRETNGVLSGNDGAASRLGIKRTTLQSMLKRFGIEPQEYRRGTGTFGSG
jgi:formate hydrogenlyase transcriptional activator